MECLLNIDKVKQLCEKNEELFEIVKNVKREIPDKTKYKKRIVKEFKLIQKNEFEKVFLHVIEILKMMGATEIISRNDYMSEPIKPLDKALYSAAVDTVGGDILAKIISMVSNHGVVSCCGNVGGAAFSSSVFPFILRGIQLSGIDSAESSIDLKSELWNLLSDEWSLDLVNQTKTIKIDDVRSEINKILKGDQIGRVVIQHGE